MDQQQAIQAAISRSRSSRTAARRRRRRSAALGALLAVGLARGGVWSIGAVTGNDVVEAAVTKAQSLADMLNQRSPGQRREAQLTKTKHARALAKQRSAVAPRHAAQASAPKPNMAELAPLLNSAPPVVATPDLAEKLPTLAFAAPPSLGAIVGPPPAGSSPGIGPGGSGPGAFSIPASKQPVTVPSAVPEPGTWAMMLLGFLAMAWPLRRSRALARPAQQA